MSWEDHEKARVIFQKDILRTLFDISLYFLEIFIKNPPNTKIQLEICQNSLLLLLKTLSWDFSTTIYLKPGYEKEDTQINPSDDTWKKLLSDVKISTYLFKLHHLFHFNNEISHIIRQSISQLATISTYCFKDDYEKVSYVQNFLEGIFNLIQKTNNEMKNEKINFGQELFDYGKILLRLILNFKLPLFLEIKSFKEILIFIYQFTIHVLNLSTKSEDEWIIECLDALLDSWVSFIPSFDFEVTKQNEKIISFIRECCVNVFIKFLETKLKSNEERFDEEYLMNDQLTSIGNLARQDIPKSLDILNTKFEERLSVYKSMIQKRNISTNLYDEIEWILKFLGYIFADDTEGETPLIPEGIDHYINKEKSNNSFFKLLNNLANFSLIEMTLISQNQKDVKLHIHLPLVFISKSN